MKIALNGQKGEKDVTKEKVKDTKEIDFAELADNINKYTRYYKSQYLNLLSK